MESLISEIRGRLESASDPETRRGSQRFFREEIRVYGIKSADVLRIAREFFPAVSGLPREEIFRICEMLMQSGMLEESFIGCHWSHNIRKLYEPSDMEVFERWIMKYVNNWATCDTLCNHNVGDLLQMYPGLLPVLSRWAVSGNRWMRRASAVSLIIPARRGLFHDEIFEIAGILLTDADDMVRKGYGWMLKSAAGPDQDRVFRFVMEHRKEMPRTALRYAIEKMPPEMKRQAMAKIN